MATTREYIYVNGIQVALVDDTGTQNEATYFVHNDHLGTPQKITDDAQTVVWGASYAPFGEVTETASVIENNIRFPGQYEDGETGLSYNYFRDYDPSLGRYVESDPIGVDGGINTYLYANADPIKFMDLVGLAPKCACNERLERSALCVAGCMSRPDKLPDAALATCCAKAKNFRTRLACCSLTALFTVMALTACDIECTRCVPK